MIELLELIQFAIVCLVFKAIWNFVNARIRFGESELKKCWVVVTGCDTGFGRSAALRLQSRGLQVIAGCLTADGLNSLKEESERNGPGKLIAIALDVSNDKSVADSCATIKKTV